LIASDPAALGGIEQVVAPLHRIVGTAAGPNSRLQIAADQIVPAALDG
jgi:hypothetical protein